MRSVNISGGQDYFQILVSGKDDGKQILLRTENTRMQVALQTAYASDASVYAEVEHEPGQADLMPTYVTRYVQFH